MVKSLSRPEIEKMAYQIEAVKLACEIEEATERVILNPFNLEAVSLEAVDYDFQADKKLWRDLVEFEESRLKHGSFLKRFTAVH